MPNEYNKLVRDRTPEVLTQAGYRYEAVTMDEPEYQQALREKLIAEALEAASANPQHLTTELADLYEVIDALMACNGINPATVQAEQGQRRKERGGFTQRIRLLRTMSQEEMIVP